MHVRFLALGGILLAFATAGCNREIPALAAARSFDKQPQFNRDFWEQERSADSALWREAHSLCSERFRATGARTPTCAQVEITRLEALAATARAAIAAATPPPPALDYNQLMDRPATAARPTQSKSRGGRGR